jgi:outer membrane PBP1 activator LpoA protein
LNAQQGKQLRSAIGDEMPLYGISQLNPRSLSAAGDAANATDSNPNPTTQAMLQPELNGVKLLDIPWQLSLDNPTVALYPRPLVGDPQKHNADLDRLYALGIDAYRVALEIGRARRSFDIDGVTGKLSISIEPAGSHFQRIETRAIYRDGVVIPIADQP